MRGLLEIARSTTERHGLLPGGSVVLALVSGGADSMALLRLLVAGDLGEPDGLSVLHVNHGLRGADADEDEVFVAAACERFGVPCRAVRVDVSAYAAEAGLNLEDAGRRLRYRLADEELDARCRVLGVSPARGRIAVAHTADDRLETLLVRLATGSGAGGLASIAPRRGRVVRPLIEARRADVVAYLEALGQEWCEDVTNADTTRQRAWVRHELLPLFESHNPSFAETAARTMAVLADEDALLGEMADAFARDFSHVEDGALVLERAALRTLSRAMARRVVRQAVCAAFPEASRIEFEHVEAIVDGLADDAFARDLSFGLRAEAEYATLRVSRRVQTAASVAPGTLDLPGRLDCGAAGVVECRGGASDEILRGPDRVSLDADAVRWPLVVDAVREGDRISPLGLGGSKKVSDLFVDAKVPRRRRALTPVVRSGADVVWVAGVALAESCRVVPGTSRVAELMWHRPTSGDDGADKRTREA